MKFQLTDVEVALSLLPETAVNTPYIATADFVGALMNAGAPPIPQLRQITDEDMVGDGNEFAEDMRPDYWEPQEPSIGGKLNTEVAGRLGIRALGGTIVSTAVTAGQSYDHISIMQTNAQGKTPKLSTLIMALGGSDFLYSSCAVQSHEITFDSDSPVQFSCALRNTGYHRRLRNITPAIVMPAPEVYHYMHPAATRVTFNDGSVRDLAADGRLLSGRCGLTNNIVVNRLPGDPFLDPAAANPRKTGAYARDIQRQRRDGIAQIKISMDEALAEYVMLQNGTDITSLSFLFRSDTQIGTSTDYFEYERKFPRCKLRVVSNDTQGEMAALTLDFFLRKDTVSGGLVTDRVRNGAATMA